MLILGTYFEIEKSTQFYKDMRTWYYLNHIICQWTYSVQFSCSVVSNSLRPHESQHAKPPCPSPTPGVHSDSCPSIQWCHPAISSCRSLLLLPLIFPSISVFSNESVLHIRCPNYWSFSFSISPSNEHSGLILFRIDLFDLLAVQGTLKSLLQHHREEKGESQIWALESRTRLETFPKIQRWCSLTNLNQNSINNTFVLI